ncbi:hypothetical protein C8F01DRAFT_1054719 [Mycena amicta]|nr:hypothetical protein C8F01DRAFT_1054719 [Mycena amicta]
MPAQPSSEPTRLKRTLDCLALATTTVKEIAHATQGHVPFLISASALCGMIVEFVQTAKTTKAHILQFLEQIHEVLCAVISLYSTRAVGKVLPPGIVHDLGVFTETLQKIYTYFKSQQEMSKIKQLFKQANSAAQLALCKQAMQDSVDAFRVHMGIAAVSDVSRIQRDVETQHEELLALLEANPELCDTEYSSVRTSSSFLNSTESLSLLPPSPKIFHGREDELQAIIQTIQLPLTTPAAHVVLLGPGGIGKTSLALSVLHHPELSSSFAQKYFVSCHAAPTSAELLAVVAAHVGVESGPNLAPRVVRQLGYTTGTARDQPKKTLLVLDNLETPWEPAIERPKVEEFLALLANVERLTILVTMRGAERPGRVMWTRPYLPPLGPLSTSAARQTFFEIADTPVDSAGVQSSDHDHNDSLITQLLELTGNLPLAINLIAHIAAYEGPRNALARWTAERTRVLSDGYDKTSSLGISIMLSLSSPRMTPDALELLSVLSVLPDGLSDADMLHSQLPIRAILGGKATLIATSLAFVDRSGRLKVLAPIGEYISTVHPPSLVLQRALRVYFHQIIHIWDRSRHPSPTGGVTQISSNLSNLNSILLKALRDFGESEHEELENIYTIVLLNSFCRQKLRTAAPIFGTLAEKFASWDWREVAYEPAYGAYFIETLQATQYVNTLNPSKHIADGEAYFARCPDAVERAQWHNALGEYYMRLDDQDRAIRNRRLALEHGTTNGVATMPARHAFQGIARVLFSQGDFVGAMENFQEALKLAQSMGDSYGEAQALTQLGMCNGSLGNFSKAGEQHIGSRELLRRIGMEGGVIDLVAENFQGEVHLLRTEYLEAKRINEHVARSRPAGHLPTAQTAFAHINIAMCAVGMGAEAVDVRQSVDLAKEQFNIIKFITVGHALCNMMYADAYLLDGNPAQARALFQSAYLEMRGRLDEGASYCLERLTDRTNAMLFDDTMLRWAGIFLASSFKSKNQLAVMKALRSFGDILLENFEDSASALAVFEVAGSGFAKLGVHRWQAECMVRVAGILEARGELVQAVTLLREARLPFEKSYQGKQIESLDRKIGKWADQTVGTPDDLIRD